MQDEAFSFSKFYLILLSAATFIILAIHKNRNGSNVLWDWPILGMIPSLVVNNDRMHDFAASALQEFKHTLQFNFGPSFMNSGFLLTCDPENINYIYSTHFNNYSKGDNFAQIFEVLGDGIFNADGESWMVQRRMALAHISDKRFRSYVEKCTKEKVSNVLLPLMNHFIEHDRVVDFDHVFLRFTFDITCALVLGVDPGSLHPDFPTIPFDEATLYLEEVFFFRHTVPMFIWKILKWMRVGKEKKTLEATEVVNHFIYQCIREKRDADQDWVNEGSFDLLTPYLNLNNDNPNDNEKFSDKFIRDTLLTFIAAGKDTTSAAINWFFWLVSTHPEVEKKILEELRNVKPTSTKMEVFEAEEINSLVYLHAAICETLRLYPSIPFNHKQPIKDDILPSGHRVYKGMKVIICSYATGRMKGVWGKDCLEYKPERWITEKGTIRHEPSYKFIAFHSGPRSCLGKNMAFTQIKLVVAAMLYNFEIRPVEGYVPKPKVSIVTQPKNGLPIKLKRRVMV